MMEISNRSESGRCLMFRHDCFHDSSPVTQGIKYVIRSDVVYQDNRWDWKTYTAISSLALLVVGAGLLIMKRKLLSGCPLKDW